MEFNEIFAIKVRKILQERKITQYQLAQLSGLYNSTLSMILNCKHNSMSVDTLIAVCRGLNVELHELLDDEIFFLENINDDK